MQKVINVLALLSFLGTSAIIGGGTYLGHYLDSLYENNNKLWTIIFSLLSIAVALYQIINSLKK